MYTTDQVDGFLLSFVILLLDKKRMFSLVDLPLTLQIDFSSLYMLGKSIH